MPEPKEEAVETLGEQASGPHQQFDPRPDVNEVVASLQQQVAQLNLELTVARLSLAKALAKITGPEGQAPSEHPE